ncbi:unnamed protein product [Dibothriocephalus latus]|uniref:leucine--tRNA ligase n=1 Tax=Dibothriocephalus latus TaxID=60516 RepID=A0A3P7M316_DIBLA|nr:unnamed protein product [Dibothriocephalus latus]
MFYARFIAHFLYDLGITPCREPFLQFLPVGLVLGQTFTDPRTGRFCAREEVEAVTLPGENKSVYRVKATGVEVADSWEKMSKSKLNGVEPAAVVTRHGLELTRLTMLASVGPHSAREWNEGESEFVTTASATNTAAITTTTATTGIIIIIIVTTSRICSFWSPPSPPLWC